MSPGTDAGAALTGREAELTRVRSTISAAVAGEATTLLISGDAGVGKTSLAQAVVASFGDELTVISGVCLPLQALSVPLHPLRLALRSTTAPGAAEILPALETPDRAPQLLDGWIDRLAEEKPVVLTIDDLQWADQSTLDVLVYLAAGPRARRLALLVTIRRERVPEGHALQRWLADVLRLPRVEQLPLRTLDRASTEEQLTSLLGAVPHQSLLDDVYARTVGNPYWTRLTVQGLAADARRLPADLPADLVTSVHRLWDALSPAARDLSRLVAVGGRPVSAETLQQVATALGWPDVMPALRESLGGRVLRSADGEHYWFDHPLLAQVLSEDLPLAERRRWHAEYARWLEHAVPDPEGPSAPPSVELAAAIAEHHDAADQPLDAFRWAMRAWRLAGDQPTPPLLALVQRVIAERGAELEAAERVDLWQRLRSAAQAAGADRDELAAIDALLAVLDEDAEPLSTSELLVRRMLLRYTVGIGFAEPADVRRAATLTATSPASWQHAQALAELAHTGFWSGDPAAPEHARAALTIARDAGRPQALSVALVASGIGEIFAGRPVRGLASVRESYQPAIAAREWIGYITAVKWEHYVLSRSLSEDPVGSLRARRETLAGHGAAATYLARVSATEADAALACGDWRSCAEHLRETLATDPGTFADVTARLVATRLAIRQGRPGEAVAHLERADELVADPRGYLNFGYEAVRAEVLLATGRAAEAYRVASVGAEAKSPRQDLSEWLVPLAARALADQAEARRLTAPQDETISAEAERLAERHPSLVSSWDPTPGAQQPALSRWYEAELARVRQASSQPQAWLDGWDEAERARMPWLQAYLGWRAAESLLSQGASSRPEGRRVLRATLELADELRAAPVLAELRALARTTRIDLSPPSRGPSAAALPGLTPREREILDHLVRGQTYAEIAGALVLSEKTVSTHVSNLLRKTGTSSRVELSQLVARLEPASDRT